MIKYMFLMVLLLVSTCGGEVSKFPMETEVSNISVNLGIPIQSNQEIKKINFCELVSNPELYHNQKVETSGLLNFGLESVFLNHLDCERESIRPKEISKIWTKSGKSSLYEITLQGKFLNEKYEKYPVRGKFQFEVIKVLSATPTNYQKLYVDRGKDKP